jgi:hypothetical protein
MRSMAEPNWPPPEWGTPEPGWDIPANVGRVDTDEVPVEAAAKPIVAPKPRRVVRSSSAKRRRWEAQDPYDQLPDKPRPKPRPVLRDSLTDEEIKAPPQVVVVHQSLTHRINELEDSVLRLERRLARLEGRQSIDDIHDGPWEMDLIH